MLVQVQAHELPLVVAELSKTDSQTAKSLAVQLSTEIQNILIENSNLKKTLEDRRKVIACDSSVDDLIDDILYKEFGYEGGYAVDDEAHAANHHIVFTTDPNENDYELIIRKAGNGYYCDYAREIDYNEQEIS